MSDERCLFCGEMIPDREMRSITGVMIPRHSMRACLTNLRDRLTEAERLLDEERGGCAVYAISNCEIEGETRLCYPCRVRRFLGAKEGGK